MGVPLTRAMPTAIAAAEGPSSLSDLQAPSTSAQSTVPPPRGPVLWHRNEHLTGYTTPGSTIPPVLGAGLGCTAPDVITSQLSPCG